ncbi:MAG: hypothetical protein J5695_06255 [Bacteroidales bacterium]|nr:hypothetical protein [Bacteroidales bacterium]
MTAGVGIQARLAWALISSAGEQTLSEPAGDYSGILERMEAQELICLIEQARQRLETMGVSPPEDVIEPPPKPVKLFIDKNYNITQNSPFGAELPLRPLVKAIFILFLKHPEGIVLKQRALYQQELEDIYSIILPNASRETVHSRVERLVSLQDNSFSEKASVLNSKLDELLPPAAAEGFKIHGTNGHPRRIPVSPLAVEWFTE